MPTVPAAVHRYCVIGLALSLSALGACQMADAQRGDFVQFDREVLDDNLPGAYGLAIADLDADGLPDVLALSNTPGELRWYAAPDWQATRIGTGTDALIDVAPFDITGNGLQDLVLASEFSLRDPEGGGLVSWLENPGSVPGEQQLRDDDAHWQRHTIDRMPASHRLRWADVSGRGHPVLINLPIIDAEASAPDYAGGVRLTAYNIPPDPRRRWGSVIVDDNLEMAHGLLVYDWNGDGREQLLTASYSGVDLFSFASGGRFVEHRNLLSATETQRPTAGISDLGVGYSNRQDRRFIATIEPWHGNSVVVYRPGPDGGEPWQREVIDEGLNSGHAIVVADLNNDGYDEIIAGGRGAPYRLNIYRYDPESRSWNAQLLDDSVAVSGLAIADLTGNGYQDIVAAGMATADVVLYRNNGR